MADVTAKMKIRLPRDQGGDGVQGALFPQETVVIAFTDVAAKNADAITAQVVRLIASQDCHVKFQDMSDALATATAMLLKAGIAEYFSINGKKYISAIRDSANGSLYVTIMY